MQQLFEWITLRKRDCELTLSLQQRLDLCNDKVVNAETERSNLRQRYSSKDKTKTPL